MVKNILVPLDGSEYSEYAIPHSIHIASIFNARITLIHIIEQNAPRSIHGQYHITNTDEAKKYLEKVVREKYKNTANVGYHIHENGNDNVARTISLHHEELTSDLVVMTTHGRGGLKELIFGNNAQQIINFGNIPVYFVPLGKETAGMTCVNKIMIPLDGSEDHEPGIEIASDLAAACGSSINLVFVIPTMNSLKIDKIGISQLLPRATEEMLNIAEDEMTTYCMIKKNELEKKGLDVEAEIYRGDPSKIITENMEKKDIDLIVLGTHGKSGLNAFWSGSIAAKIISRSNTAMLLIPLKQEL